MWYTFPMKTRFLKLFLPLCIIAFSSGSARAAEPWKGHTETSPLELGVMTGLSIFGTETAWGFLANAAYLIQPNGWVDDVDDRIWIETQMGPSFFPSRAGLSGSGFQFNAHLRWDFTYNEYWTVYGLGGIGGYALPPALASKFNLHPRFGAGVEYQTKAALMFRAEVSAEFVGLGVALNF